ncbi:hypothetical protein B0J14DRAFT_535042 [Halenospora varia]|nr:hypothetical protein B0J14DRAFT_535042 [Halenospora varia]
MPSAVSSMPAAGGEVITKFTNCLLLDPNTLTLTSSDLWVSSLTGRILSSQVLFYGIHRVPDQIVDLGGRILAPGLIDVQLNGAFGFNFSHIPENPSEYGKTLRQVNKRLVETGVTSYVPTLTSSPQEVYKNALPFLGPSGAERISEDGAESLGAHVEGPFISPSKNGIHPVSVLKTAPNGYRDLEDMYGAENINPAISPNGTALPPKIRKLTAAPEVLSNLEETISKLTSRGIVYSIGHTEATYELATTAISSGATMITHLFNAMAPLHHRNPGVFGTLGTPPSPAGDSRPFFGLIADSIHLHPTTIKIAYSTHPTGCILVTDAMHLVGLPNGCYSWSGDRIVKNGSKLTLEGTDKIAGSSITLIECVSNFLNWTGCSVQEAVRAVTWTPARMLGLEGAKGGVREGGDADLVVIDLLEDEGGKKDLKIDQVWKFGKKVWVRAE